MALHLLVLLLLGSSGRGWADSHPEVLQVPAGGSIQVQCLYGLQDTRSQKVWCRFLPDGCQALGSSAVDRRAPRGGRTFLTDLGGGLLQVEMVTLQKEDAGEYGCVVEGATGPQTVHRVTLDVLPTEETGKEETIRSGSLSHDPSSKPMGSIVPVDDIPRQDDKTVPLIWGTVLLLGLLVVAVVLFVVVARKRGNRLGVCGQFQNNGISRKELHSTADSAVAGDGSSDVPYVRLDSPPSFDTTTYSNLPLGPLSGKPPASSSSPPLPPKRCSQPVTYAMVIFPRGEKGGGAPCEPAAQDPPNSQGAPS
ncbi:trem-like transcript 1 protein [Sorex araneus]|uniref:trem-like transcript 1 protein n=1 Tax=Sorex araneus TaxID=42254 RepID=UPI0024337CF9|nr:trem-like transcript 1 protein [Sorex araneus]